MQAPLGINDRFNPGSRVRIVWVFFVVAVAALTAPSLGAQSAAFLGVESTVDSVNSSQGVAVDAVGNVYIADTIRNRVVEISPSGLQTTVGFGLLAPKGVAVDRFFNVYIADTGNARVLKVSPGSGQQVVVGAGLSAPDSVAVDAQSNVYIADASKSSLIVVSSNGGQTLLGTGLTNAFGVAVDAAGDVFVAVPGLSSLVEIPANRGPQVSIGSGLSNPVGVAVDGSGNLFIADQGNNRVVKIQAGSNGESTFLSGVTSPRAVAADSAGDVFVALPSLVVEFAPGVSKFSGAYVCSNSLASACSQSLSFLYSITTGGTLGSANVVTQGAPNLDFVLSGSTCSGSLNTGSVCEVDVNFAPLAPGLRMGAVELTDSSNKPLVTTLISGVGFGAGVAFGPGKQTNFAVISDPTGLAVDAAGDVFITSYSYSTVTKIPAGGGAAVQVGTNLADPLAVAVDGAGNVFITDTVHDQVSKFPAGGGTSYTTVGAGLKLPQGVAIDGAGNVYISDPGNNRVVKVPADGSAQTTVGSGLASPWGVAVDGSGNVFISDSGNNRVVEVSAVGALSTLGSGLLHPAGLAVDAAGNVFVADEGNRRVLKLSPDGSQTSVGSGFTTPTDVAVDGSGNIFIADFGGGHVVEVQRSQTPSFSFATAAAGSTSSDSPQSVSVDSIGNVALVLSGLAVDANFQQTPGPGTPADCAGGSTLSPGTSCNLSISFIPTTKGLLTGNATLTDNALNPSGNATQIVSLSGTGTQGSQTITFNAIPTQTVGGTLTLSASASSGLAVSFSSLSTAICTVSGNSATFVAQGSCIIQASQGGNGTYSAATPVSQSFSVTQQSQTITFNAIPTQTVGGTLTLSASATSGLAVSFSSLSTAICTVSGNSATFVAQGSCIIQASQGGNGTYSAATPVSQSFSVIQQTQTITFNTIPTQPVGGTLTLSASATSGLAVTFTSLTPTVCTISGNSAMFAAKGGCTIQASQAGNGTYSAATPVSQSFSVIQQAQTITFNTIPTQPVGGTLTLSASATSGLAVAFTSLTPAVCTVSFSTATMVTAGTCSIQASQTGNTTYAAATPVLQSFAVTDFSMSVSPASQTISSGHTATYIVTVSPVNEFSGTVALTCAGGPSHSICSISPASVALSGSGASSSISVEMETPQNVNHGTFTLTITGKFGTDLHTATASITVK